MVVGGEMISDRCVLTPPPLAERSDTSGVTRSAAGERPACDIGGADSKHRLKITECFCD